MMPPRPLALAKLWLSVGWLAVLAVAVASLMPLSDVQVEIDDKLAHALVYGFLMLWFLQLYPGRQSRSLVAVALFGLGAGLECIQGAGGYRSFELADMFANGTGIAAGWLLGETALAGALARVEALCRVKPR